MNKSDLESKRLADLHELAAEANVPKYRMLSRAELIEKLAGGDGGKQSSGGGSRSRSRGSRGGRSRGERSRGGRERRERSKDDDERREERQPREQKQQGARESQSKASEGRPKRKRRRRFRRRRKEVRVHELLLPPAPGRRTIVYAESRSGATGLLRELAADLAKASKGPDPIAVLVDPPPEELAEWRRDAPQAEIVAAGQARHVEDAVAQATSRAAGGEDVIVLIDSLSRFAEAFGDAEAAQEVFEAGDDGGGSGTLTLLAAVEASS